MSAPRYVPRDMGRACVVCACVAGFALAAAPAGAGIDREGWYVGVGGGTASGNVGANAPLALDENAPEPRLDPRESGGVFDLRIGWHALPDMAFGLEAWTWSRHLGDHAPARLDMIAAALAVTWYPGRHDVFLRLGYGVGEARVRTIERGDDRIRHDPGGGGLLALGVDFGLGAGAVLSPQLQTAAFGTRDLDLWASATGAALVLTVFP